MPTERQRMARFLGLVTEYALQWSIVTNVRVNIEAMSPFDDGLRGRVQLTYKGYFYGEARPAIAYDFSVNDICENDHGELIADMKRRIDAKLVEIRNGNGKV